MEALRSGRPVMIYDSSDREGEVDLVFHASQINHRKIAVLRREAGGLICFATSNRVRRALGIPFMNEFLGQHPQLGRLATRRLGYGDPPAFTLWVNHVDSVTGIRDRDRALTARRLYDVVVLVERGEEEEARRIFYDEFTAPGHLPILASRGLERRRGHTELAIALAGLAGMPPAVVFAEMLVDGGVLSVEEARRISHEHSIPLVSGKEIIEAHSNTQRSG